MVDPEANITQRGLLFQAFAHRWADLGLIERPWQRILKGCRAAFPLWLTICRRGSFERSSPPL